MRNLSLIMSCTSLGRSPKNYARDVAMANIACHFHEGIYPQSDIYIGVDKATQNASEMPAIEGKVLGYDFSTHPFAMARMGFYRACCMSDKVSDGSILFAGIDVLSLRSLPDDFLEHDVVMSYRWHPTQPYCSDFIFVKNKDSGLRFFSAVIDTMAWMPREIQHGAADQLSLAIVMGHIHSDEFNGKSKMAPKFKGGFLVPGDDFFFCPGDYFSSSKENGSPGERKDDLHLSVDALIRESASKYALHFKGDRKSSLFAFAEKYAIFSDNPFSQAVA